MMDLVQASIVKLTMEFDLKVREYQKICETVDKLKEKNVNPNYKRLEDVKDILLKKQTEIQEIKERLEELKRKI